MKDTYLFNLFFIMFLFTMFEPFIINFVYMKNIDLFLDIILFKKNKTKLLKHIFDNYCEVLDDDK